MSSDAPDHASTPRPRPATEDEISLWEVLAVLIRRRWTIVLTTFVMGVISVGTGFLRTNFSTATTFRPQGAELPGSGLLSLASQFGVSVPGLGASGAGTPQFYAELAKSRAILTAIADRTYEVADVGTTTLVDLLEIREDTPELERREVLEWLSEEAVTASVATETGTVTVSVVTEWPEVSYDILRTLLDGVVDFNLNVRQSQAAEERRFIEARVDSARAEVLAVESRLQGFLEANRQFEQAPLLVFQHERLQRDVILKQSILTTLSQSLEQARIAEKRDTPVITVVSPPFMPPGRDPRGTVLRAAIGFVLGVTLGSVLAFFQEAIAAPATGDPSREDFQESWNGFLRSIPILGRIIG